MSVVTNLYAPYWVPILAELAKRVDLEVIYSSTYGGSQFRWKVPDLPFRHVFVDGHRVRGRTQVQVGMANRRSEYFPSPRIVKLLRKHQPSAVLASGYSFPTYYSLMHCTASGSRLLLVSEGTEYSEAEIGPFQMLSRRLLIPLSDGGIGVSRDAAARLATLGMPDDCVFESFYPPYHGPPVQSIRTRASASRCRFLYVGRLVQVKGLHHLLEAFSLARQAAPHIELEVVGEGPEQPALVRLVNALGLDESIRFRGFVDQDALPEVYAAADAFVFPTLYDPYGVVVGEAAAAGLPIIASRHAGATRELIVPDRTGLVVDPQDREALAGAVVRLALDPDLRTRLGTAAHDLVRERTPANSADRFAQAIEATLRKPPRRSRFLSRLRFP